MSQDKSNSTVTPIPTNWWIHWLLPRAVLEVKSTTLIDGWIERENVHCRGIIRWVALIGAILQGLFFYLDTLRVQYSFGFSFAHRFGCATLFLTVFIMISKQTLTRFRFAFLGYKATFLVSSLILAGFQMVLMIRIPDIPRAYPAAILVTMVATSGIGPMNATVLTTIHTIMLIIVGILHRDQISWSNIVSDVSLQIISIVLIFTITSKYTLQAKLFIADWRERNRMSKLVDLTKKWGDHAFNQLTKLVYSHVVHQIYNGSVLEETMPTGKSEAYTISFDIISSSKIKHENFDQAVEQTLIRCFEAMNAGYNQETMVNNAYRIKDLGDGFLCSVGFPFKTPNEIPGAILAENLSHKFINIFREEMDRLDYPFPINCAIGLAYGEIEGYFPSAGIKQYDLRGRSIVMATRYESLRKQLSPEWIKNCDLIIFTEHVFVSLPKLTRQKYELIDLKKDNLSVRDDPNANHAYIARLSA